MDKVGLAFYWSAHSIYSKSQRVDGNILWTETQKSYYWWKFGHFVKYQMDYKIVSIYNLDTNLSKFSNNQYKLSKTFKRFSY